MLNEISMLCREHGKRGKEVPYDDIAQIYFMTEEMNKLTIVRNYYV